MLFSFSRRIASAFKEAKISAARFAGKTFTPGRDSGFLSRALFGFMDVTRPGVLSLQQKLGWNLLCSVSGVIFQSFWAFFYLILKLYSYFSILFYLWGIRKEVIYCSFFPPQDLNLICSILGLLVRNITKECLKL